MRSSDAPNVTSMNVGERQLLQATSDEGDSVGAFCRLHHSGFTNKELSAHMNSEWGAPTSQLSITATPKTDE